MIMAKEGRSAMKLLIILVVASVAFPAVINALEYELEKSASYFEGSHAVKKLSLRPEPIPTVKVIEKPPPPRPKGPLPKPWYPVPKPKSPPPKRKSPPPKRKAPPLKPKSPPPKPKCPPPQPKSPPPKPKSPPPPPPPVLSLPPLAANPPRPSPSSPPPATTTPPPVLLSPPPPSSSPLPPSPSPLPPSPSPLPPSPSLPPPLPSPPPPEPSPAPSPPTERPPPPPPEPWDTHYMNLYTPSDPAGGLVLSDDRMHVDMKITSRQQIFGHFISKYRFIYGYFSIYMKLIPRDSAGTIMTYYFSSPERQNKTEDTHDECDFEFLGNVSGQPITLQTNVFLNGRGNREVRHYLPFDPTEAFHKYSLLWNENLIIWYVDDEVIRVYHNRTDVPYPTFRPMAVQASLWNGSDWATQGGKVKLNISNAPFILQYEGFNGVDGCRACDTYPMTDPSSACTNPDISHCSSGYWFNEQKELTTTEVAQLKAHTDKYVIYNYCRDYIRFPNGFPPECAYNFG